MAFTIQTHREMTQLQTKQDPTLGIMKWGTDNSFPSTLKNLIEQSSSGKEAVNRAATFYKGGSFEGEDTIVSEQGLTLKKVVSIMAEDYATFRAFAVQTNYNLKGKISSLNPMRIETLRFSEFDELNFANKIGYHRNFGRNAVDQKVIDSFPVAGEIKWFNRFNPNAVETQIEHTEGGISNYLGQLLYHTDSGHSSYPIPPFQASINYLLSDIENSILIRKETATGFINSFLFKTTMDASDTRLDAIQGAIIESQGARGTGKVIVIPGLTPEEVSSTVLEEMASGGSRKTTMETSIMTYELNKAVLTGAYLIPPALSGIDMATGFSGADLQEAYFVFNAVTQNGRDIIESEINRILKLSDFDVKSIKLNKLALDLDEEMVVETDKTE